MSGEPAAERRRFVAESYWPAAAEGEIPAAAGRIDRAAADLAATVGRVRLLRCTLAPADELCAWLFEAETEAAIRSVAGRAGLDLERLGPAVDVWPPGRQRR